MVERTLPKPDTRVRFPSAAPLASPAVRLETSFLGLRESLTLKNRPIRDDFLPPARQPLSKVLVFARAFLFSWLTREQVVLAACQSNKNTARKHNEGCVLA